MEAGPVRFGPLTSEAVLLDWVGPQLAQLQTPSLDLLVVQMQSTSGSALQKAITQEQRRLGLRIGVCVRMAFDHQCFAPKGVYHYRTIDVSGVIVPARAHEHTTLVFCCGVFHVSNLDQCKATFKNPVTGEGVRADSYHLIGNLFCVPIPYLSFLKESEWTNVEVTLACDGRTSTASVELTRAVIGTWRPQCPVYTEDSLPLHLAVCREDTAAVLEYVSTHSVADVGRADSRGVTPATIALWRGNRVIYTLLTWKSFGWPPYAVSQLLRARLELECCAQTYTDFCELKGYIHNALFGGGSSDFSRLGTRRSSNVAAPSLVPGTLASLLMSELPTQFGRTPSSNSTAATTDGAVQPHPPSAVPPQQHYQQGAAQQQQQHYHHQPQLYPPAVARVQPTPFRGQAPQQPRRRDSLDVLLSAIENLERTDT